MRVIRSPTGSFIDMPTSSPTRLDEARDKALGAEIPQCDARQLVLAIKSARTSRHLAAITHARGGGIARQLRKLKRRFEALFHRLGLVLRDFLQARATAGESFCHSPSSIILLNRTLLRHS